MSLGLRDFVPPVAGKIARRLFGAKTRQVDLFEGEGKLFKEALSSCRIYGEYGMGASTKWVLANTQAKVIAVDTSQEWVNHVVTTNDQPDRLDARWVDVGPVGDWGRPISYSMRANFTLYVEALWNQDSKPEVVLIDGRFRVCCFLQSLLSSSPGTQLIFDDYTNRPKYHLVEEIVARSETHGRQARFVTPATFDRRRCEELRDKFLYVID